MGAHHYAYAQQATGVVVDGCPTIDHFVHQGNDSDAGIDDAQKLSESLGDLVTAETVERFHQQGCSGGNSAGLDGQEESGQGSLRGVYPTECRDSLILHPEAAVDPQAVLGSVIFGSLHLAAQTVSLELLRPGKSNIGIGYP